MNCFFKLSNMLYCKHSEKNDTKVSESVQYNNTH